jgi:predicted  nucleic acid-binding Zn-ribbon protein
MTRLIALAGLAAYVCQTPIEHDGKLLPIGSPIELDTEAAQQLLDVQAIGHSDGNAPQVLQSAGFDVGDVLKLAKALEQAEQQLAQLRGGLSEAHTDLARHEQTLRELQAAHETAVAALRDELAAANIKAHELEGALGQAKADAAADAEKHSAEIAKLHQQIADAAAPQPASKKK